MCWLGHISDMIEQSDGNTMMENMALEFFFFFYKSSFLPVYYKIITQVQTLP